MQTEQNPKGLLIRLLSVLLILSLGGCAGKPQATPPPSEPMARRVPVQVSPPPPPAPAAKPHKPKPPADTARDEEVIQDYARALKKVRTVPRTPPKDEKVYPIDLNLRNADLVEAVRVLAETMSLNYMIDPRVKGTANVRAAGKLTQSELLAILETVLVVNGATLVKADKLYRIIPMEKASATALPVYARGETPQGMSVQVVFLEQTASKEMLTALKPMVSSGGSIVEGAANSLILVDYPANLEKLLKLIGLIDSQALSQTLVRVVKVNNTDPNEIIGELETIFSAYGALAQKGKFGVGFVPVQRLNSVMALAASAPLMERAVYWIKQLDSQTDMLANVHVYHVVNYRAKNLADLLTQAYGGQAAAPTLKEKKPDTGPRMDTGFGRGTGGLGTGTGLGTGGSGTRSPFGGGLGGGISPMEGAAGQSLGETPPGGRPAAPALKERAAPTAAAPGAGVPKEGVRIIPDEENNLLVVVAPPHEWRIISELLRRLDVMPRQVLNEVLIAEVKLTDEFRFGVQWFLGARQGTPGTQTPGPVDPNLPPTGQNLAPFIFTGQAGAVVTDTGAFTVAIRDTANALAVIINALAADGKVNILASPQIMAANNQEARIQIGDEVPILTSESVPLVSQVTSFQTSTVQYRSTGIILTVKPQINANGLITLEIAQEVSSAVPTTTGVRGTPTISIRQAKTQLITANNQTIVLGGLIREDNTRNKSGIPLLRKMPVVGPLFGFEENKTERTELIVLITPHIVSTLEDGARITREVKERVGIKETPAPPRTRAAPGTPPPPPGQPKAP